MVNNLIDALHEDLTTLDWMSPATRVQAIKKLQAITLKIGYPDKWRDYSAFKVDRVSLCREQNARQDIRISAVTWPRSGSLWTGPNGR